MSAFTFRFFGAGQLQNASGKIVPIRARKQLALLAYLLIESDRAHSRDSLIALFWPNHSIEPARNNLRVTLSNLRKLTALPSNVTATSSGSKGNEPLILSSQFDIQINPGADSWLDVVEFEKLIQQIRAHSHSSHLERTEYTECQPLLEKAAALYRGEFLAGLSLDDAPEFEEWLFMTREHLAVGAIDVQMQLTEGYLSKGDYQAAETSVRRWLELDSLQEIAHRRLMELLTINGRPHAALAHYEQCRQLLDDELGVPPADETVTLYQQIRDGQFDNPDLTQGVGMMGSPVHPLTRSPAHSLPPSAPHLFGIESALQQLRTAVCAPDHAWIVSVEGIGGIGKTSLAQELVNQVEGSGEFGQVVWMSAKQEEFRTESGIQPTELPALDAAQLVSDLLHQLSDGPQPGSAEEKEALLRQKLNAGATLVVIDNLETVADYQALLPLLRTFSNPSKFLITSRESLSQYQDVFCLSLGELSQPHAFELLRYEASTRGIRTLAAATDDALAQITDVVGGHPLALNLVLGQLVFLPLTQVLESLRQATGQRVDELYTYIYWQAWQTLDDPSRQLFLTLPTVTNGTYAQLAAISLLEPDELQAGLAQLIGLSLIQVAGDLLEPRYCLHRLTETFLMNEVLKWQSL